MKVLVMGGGVIGVTTAYQLLRDGHEVKLLNAKQLAGGEVLDLTEDIEPNYDFFISGPGYDALD